MEDIIQKMIDQHRALQQNLGSASDLAKQDKPDKNGIVAALEEFKKNLLEHLKLENGEFYPDLLKKMEARNMDTLKTKAFIAEMDEIGKVVIAFLGKYSKPEAIDEKFKEDLKGIINALNLRIESEESGVFTYFSTI